MEEETGSEATEAEQLGDFFEERGLDIDLSEAQEETLEAEPIEEAPQEVEVASEAQEEARKATARENYARRQADSRLKAENDALRAQMQQYQAHLQQQQKAAQQPPPAQEEPEVPPSIEDDPEAYVQYEFRRLKAENDAIKARFAQADQAQRQYQAHQQEMAKRNSFLSEIKQAETEWESQHQGYRDRFSQNVSSIKDFWTGIGLTDQEATALVQSEMEGIAHIAKHRGIHPSFIMEQWHNQFIAGRKAPSGGLDPMKAKAAIDAARKAHMGGDSGSISNGSGGRGGAISVDRVRKEGFKSGEVAAMIDSDGLDTYFEYMKRAGG